MAEQVIKIIHELAYKYNKTIAYTIHQPSSAI